MVNTTVNYRYMVSWQHPTTNYDSLLYYIVQYRRDLGNGQYGEWQASSGNIDRTETSWVIELPSAGDYEYRVLGVLPGDVEVTQKTGQATVGGGTATTAATSMY